MIDELSEYTKMTRLDPPAYKTYLKVLEDRRNKSETETIELLYKYNTLTVKPLLDEDEEYEYAYTEEFILRADDWEDEQEAKFELAMVNVFGEIQDEELRYIYLNKLIDLIVLYFHSDKYRAYNQKKRKGEEKNRITRYRRGINKLSKLPLGEDYEEIPTARKTEPTKKHIEELLESIREDVFEGRWEKRIKQLVDSIKL